MGLNVATLILVLAITFMNSIWGVYSGLINAFCAIASLCISLGFYEALNEWVTRSFEISPAYTEPCCLILLYALSLLALRSAADNLVRGNVSVPMQIDWAGAAACGFVIAQVNVGVLALAVQMLPVGGTVMGFTRYERSDENDPDNAAIVKFERKSLWTRSDEFAVGLFNMLSNGALKGGTTFASVYPDFVDSIYYSSNTVQPQSSPAPRRDKKNGDGFSKGLKVESWWEQKGEFEGRYRREVPTETNSTPPFTNVNYRVPTGMRLLGARLALLNPAADSDQHNRLHLFRPSMIRLVGTENSVPAQYIPRIITGADSRLDKDAARIVDPDNNFALPAEGEAFIDVYFQVSEEFRPQFVEYRRHARAALKGEPAAAAPTGPLAAGSTTAAEGQGDVSRGSGRFIGDVLSHQSGESDGLPFGIVAEQARRSGAEIKGNTIVKSRISGPKERFEGREGQEVAERFAVPDGYRLVQIRYKPKEARTLVGDVFNYIAQVSQYFVQDDTGDKVPLAGYYAIVTRGGKPYLELFYNGPPDDQLEPGHRSMLDFKSIEFREWNDQDEAEMCLMFLVKAGRKIVRFENQKGEGGELNIQTRP